MHESAYYSYHTDVCHHDDTQSLQRDRLCLSLHSTAADKDAGRPECENASVPLIQKKTRYEFKNDVHTSIASGDGARFRVRDVPGTRWSISPGCYRAL